MGKNNNVFSFYVSHGVLCLKVECPNTKLQGLVLQSVCAGLLSEGFSRVPSYCLFGRQDVEMEKVSVGVPLGT